MRLANFRLASARASVKELKKNIEIAEERRDYFLRYLQELWQDVEREKIQEDFALRTEYEKRDGKTIREWVIYYNNYIKECRALIAEHKKKQKNSRNISVLFFSVFLIGFVFFSSTVLNFSFFSLTGFVTLTVSGGTTTICGEVTEYDKIVVESGGILQVCPYNGTAGTGYANITLGEQGNFTVYEGGIVNLSGAGGYGGQGSIGSGGAGTGAYQGMNSTTNAGAAATTANGGGGGGGQRNGGSAADGGGGGGFGGVGGRGANASNGGNDVPGFGGNTYGIEDSEILFSGSGGGGGAGDTINTSALPGGKGAGGIKINVSTGVINIAGSIIAEGDQGYDNVGGITTDVGGGGGGSGGHIILIGRDITLSGTLSANGGRGGNAGTIAEDLCGGGGGGGGRILISYTDLNNGSSTVTASGGTKGDTGTSCTPVSVVGSEGTIFYNSTTFGSAPTIPTDLTCDGNSNCNISAYGVVTLNTSGSTDAEGDAITYVIGAFLIDPKIHEDATDVNLIGTRGGGWQPIGTPTIGYTFGTAVDNATVVNLPTGLQPGDIVIVAMASDNRLDSDGVNTTGYTSINATTSAIPGGEAKYKVMGASPDSTVSIKNNNAARVSYIIQAWRGVDVNIPIDVTTTTADSAGSNSGDPNSPSITPTTNSSLVFTIGLVDDDDTATVTTVPLEYNNSNLSNTGQGSTNAGASVVIALKIWLTGIAEDPAAWVLSSGDDWRGLTVALRPNVSSSEINTTTTTYSDIAKDQGEIDNITITLEVDSYDPIASVNQTTNDPDLWLEMYNGTEWVSIGNFNLPATYTGTGLDTTNHNFSLITTNAGVLAGWVNKTNQDLRVKGVYLDYYNDTVIDSINYTHLWVRIEGIGWYELGQFANGETFSWNTSEFLEQNCVNLRTRAIDLEGSNLYSDYFFRNSCLNISHSPVSNSAPTIPYIQEIAATDPAIGTTRAITFNFTAEDSDGVSDLNDATAVAYFNKSGEATRSNTSCLQIGSPSGNQQNYSCTIDMWYFDGNGEWTINVSIEDDSEEYAENSSTTFTYNLLTAMNMSPNSLAWPSPISPSDADIGSNNDPITINNSGNAVDLSINVTAYDLRGEEITTQFIYAGNFTVGNTGEGCSGTAMSNATSANITSAILQRGNNSLNFNNETSGQEQIFFCLKEVPKTISAQSYSSSAYGAWEIRVLLVALILKRKRKKELKRGNKILELIINLRSELKKDFSEEKERMIRQLMVAVQKEYSVSKKEILNIVRERKEKIPINIFSKELGALESLVKYMKENLNLSYKEIALKLNRDERTIWTAYHKAIKKQREAIKIRKPKILVPIEEFNKEGLTILESLIVYLKKDMKFSEISLTINRDQRNVWTIYSRAKKKVNMGKE